MVINNYFHLLILHHLWRLETSQPTHQGYSGTWHGDVQIITKTKSVQKTDTISERDFGKSDRYIREKPNASMLALKAHIFFTTNKTAKWLDSKSGKAKLFAMAQKASPQHQRQGETEGNRQTDRKH